ncbi:MAG: hypothetical protein H7177_11960 [Rhizobacter sp.]|nr:hypothetical protein [Bacteriovorax sp.]
MKKIIGILLLLGLTSQAFAYSMQELEGKYRVSSTALKMKNTLIVDKKGKLTLIEELNRFTCSGKSKIDRANMVDASIKCEKFFGNRVFTFKIDMTKVQDLNNFKAPLVFPMIGETIWTFERFEN